MRRDANRVLHPPALDLRERDAEVAADGRRDVDAVRRSGFGLFACRRWRLRRDRHRFVQPFSTTAPADSRISPSSSCSFRYLAFDGVL